MSRLTLLRKTRLLKFTAVFMSFIFLSTSVVSAGPVNTHSLSLSENAKLILKTERISDLFILENYGSIIKKWEPETVENNKSVIIIQDAHCNYEAQHNIAKILETLVRDYKIDLVAIEGAAGDIDLNRFGELEDTKTKEKVTDIFVKEGIVTGPEYLRITKYNEVPFGLYGIEDGELYVKNFISFRDSISNSKETQFFIDELSNIVTRLKEKIYSKELLEFDNKVHSYNSNEISLTDYIRELYKRVNIDSKKYPDICRVYRSIKLEEGIDFKKVEREREELIRNIEKNLPKEELEEFVKKCLLFKLGKVSSIEYYSFLKRYLNQFRQINLRRYIHLTKIQAKIDSDGLFKDMQDIEDKIKESLFNNNIERSLDNLSKRIDILNKLFKLQLARRDLEYFKNHKDEFSTSSLLSLIKIQAPLNNIRLSPIFNDNGFLKRIDGYIIPSDRFYEEALLRDEALVKNTLEKMGEEDKDIAIMITGGFHTEGITRLIQAKGMGYIVISPKITKIQENNPYLSLMMDERLLPSDKNIPQNMLSVPELLADTNRLRKFLNGLDAVGNEFADRLIGLIQKRQGGVISEEEFIEQLSKVIGDEIKRQEDSGNPNETYIGILRSIESSILGNRSPAISSKGKDGRPHYGENGLNKTIKRALVKKAREQGKAEGEDADPDFKVIINGKIYRVYLVDTDESHAQRRGNNLYISKQEYEEKGLAAIAHEAIEREEVMRLVREKTGKDLSDQEVVDWLDKNPDMARDIHQKAHNEALKRERYAKVNLIPALKSTHDDLSVRDLIKDYLKLLSVHLDSAAIEDIVDDLTKHSVEIVIDEILGNIVRLYYQRQEITDYMDGLNLDSELDRNQKLLEIIAKRGNFELVISRLLNLYEKSEYAIKYKIIFILISLIKLLPSETQVIDRQLLPFIKDKIDIWIKISNDLIQKEEELRQVSKDEWIANEDRYNKEYANLIKEKKEQIVLMNVLFELIRETIASYMKAGRSAKVKEIVLFLLSKMDDPTVDKNLKAEVISFLSDLIEKDTPEINILLAGKLSPRLSGENRQNIEESLAKTARNEDIIKALETKDLDERLAYLIILSHIDRGELLKAIIMNKALPINIRLYAFGWYATKYLSSEEELAQFISELADESYSMLKNLAEDMRIKELFNNLLLQNEEAKVYIMAIFVVLHKYYPIVKYEDFKSISETIMHAKLLGYDDNANSGFEIGKKLIGRAQDIAKFFLTTIAHELMHNILHKLGFDSLGSLPNAIVHEFMSDIYAFVLAEILDMVSAISQERDLLWYEHHLRDVTDNDGNTTEEHEGARAQLLLLEREFEKQGKKISWKNLMLAGLSVLTNPNRPKELDTIIKEVIQKYVEIMNGAEAPEIRYEVLSVFSDLAAFDLKELIFGNRQPPKVRILAGNDIAVLVQGLKDRLSLLFRRKLESLGLSKETIDEIMKRGGLSIENGKIKGNRHILKLIAKIEGTSPGTILRKSLFHEMIHSLLQLLLGTEKKRELLSKLREKLGKDYGAVRNTLENNFGKFDTDEEFLEELIAKYYTYRFCGSDRDIFGVGIMVEIGQLIDSITPKNLYNLFTIVGENTKKAQIKKLKELSKIVKESGGNIRIQFQKDRGAEMLAEEINNLISKLNNYEALRQYQRKVLIDNLSEMLGLPSDHINEILGTDKYELAQSLINLIKADGEVSQNEIQIISEQASVVEEIFKKVDIREESLVSEEIKEKIAMFLAIRALEKVAEPKKPGFVVKLVKALEDKAGNAGIDKDFIEGVIDHLCDEVDGFEEEDGALHPTRYFVSFIELMKETFEITDSDPINNMIQQLITYKYVQAVTRRAFAIKGNEKPIPSKNIDEIINRYVHDRGERYKVNIANVLALYLLNPDSVGISGESISNINKLKNRKGLGDRDWAKEASDAINRNIVDENKVNREVRIERIKLLAGAKVSKMEKDEVVTAYNNYGRRIAEGLRLEEEFDLEVSNTTFTYDVTSIFGNFEARQDGQFNLYDINTLSLAMIGLIAKIQKTKGYGNRNLFVTEGELSDNQKEALIELLKRHGITDITKDQFVSVEGYEIKAHEGGNKVVAMTGESLNNRLKDKKVHKEGDRVLLANQAENDFMLLANMAIVAASTKELEGENGMKARFRQLFRAYYKGSIGEDDIEEWISKIDIVNGIIQILLPPISPFVKAYYDTLKGARELIQQAA